MFAAWGRTVYRHRWVTLIASLVLLVASVTALSQGGMLGFSNPPQTESGRAATLMDKELPHTSSGGSSFILVFGSRAQGVHEASFRGAMLSALAPLHADRRITSILTPYDVPSSQAAAFASRDGHHALAVVAVKDVVSVASGYYAHLRSLVHSSSLDVVATGGLAVNHDFNTILNKDLGRAEGLSFPLALLLLLIVFGTVVAAVLPLGVGLLTVVGGLGGVFLLTRVTDVSQYALNIVTLIGLGVAFDYSLFIVNRFREELASGATVEESLARALATAGRAIAFSGLTVAIGLCGLLFYQGTFLASMGLAGAISVAFAVVYALSFLPAVLALLGPRVNAWRVPLPRRTRSGGGFWHGLTTAVMRRPVLVLVGTMVFVLLAGSPFLGLRLAGASVTALPPNAQSHRGYDLMVAQFPGQDETQMTVVVDYPAGHALSGAHAGALYDLSRRIARLPNVLRVEGPLNLSPTLGRTDYQRLYAHPTALSPAIRAAIHGSVGSHIVTLSVLTAQPASSDAARAIVHSIRAMHSAGNGLILVTGTTAADIDAIDLIISHTPAALAFIMVMTYLVLFLLLGSVILPLKAVLTDVLSISASFGALVWIFQQGHLSNLLNVTPAPLDPSVPILLFCIVFGLSMDYEVFLLSRMKEEYERTGETRQAVATGIERSGRLITGAAAIMVAVFLTFALAETSLIKAIGLGMAIAVVVDATIVRALLVPAVMCLLGDLNWWAPRPLANLYRRLNLGESRSAQTATDNAAA